MVPFDTNVCPPENRDEVLVLAVPSDGLQNALTRCG